MVDPGTPLKEAWAPYVRALLAFHRGEGDAALRVRDDLGNDDTIAVAHFFRQPSPGHTEGAANARFPPLELQALDVCRGRVLDVGAGAGAHALELQRRGLEVVAMEPHPELAALLRERGVRTVAEGGFGAGRRAGVEVGAEPEPLAEGSVDGASHPSALPAAPLVPSFDTILLLMNGWGLAGTLGGLPHLLQELGDLLAPGGQILADSTPPERFLEAAEGTDGPGWPSRHGEAVDLEAVGEVHFQWEFRGEAGPPFPFLFLDPGTLVRVAGERGWQVEILAREAEGGYLSRLIRR